MDKPAVCSKDSEGNDRTEEAILPREEIVIAILKFVKVIIE
jgi:hypothetical protein